MSIKKYKNGLKLTRTPLTSSTATRYLKRGTNQWGKSNTTKQKSLFRAFKSGAFKKK